MNKLQFKIPQTVNFNIDAALRYWPVFKEIKSLKISNPKILEVGCWSGGITQFMPYSITGLDANFEKQPSKNNLVKLTKGSILKIPFTDKSFDIVVCVDVLEHLSKQDHQKAIEELIRVGDRKIIIAFPCGKIAQKYDQKLNKLYKRQTGSDHRWLKEHLICGLPVESEIKKEILKIIPLSNLKIIDNSNLKIWFLRHYLFTIHREWILKRLGKKLFFIFIILAFFLFRYLNLKPAYRKIMVIQK